MSASLSFVRSGSWHQESHFLPQYSPDPLHLCQFHWIRLKAPTRHTSKSIAVLEIRARSSPSFLDDAVASWLLRGRRCGVARGLAPGGLIGLLGFV